MKSFKMAAIAAIATLAIGANVNAQTGTTTSKKGGNQTEVSTQTQAKVELSQKDQQAMAGVKAEVQTIRQNLKNGTIIAARVDGYGTTLKRFYRNGDRVTLKPANRKYNPIEVSAVQVQVQGSLIGVWRGY